MSSGDEQAFGEIFARYRGIVYATVYTVLLDPEAAERVVDDTFREARRAALPFLQTHCSVSGWLTHIARLCVAGILGANVLKQPRARQEDPVTPTP